MKARLLRDELLTHPDLKSWDDIRSLVNDLHTDKITKAEFNARRFVAAKAGTVIDHPYVWALVSMGRAEPFDDECKKRADRAMQGPGDLDTRIAAAVEAADLLDSAQVTGDEEHDASPEQVEAMKQARAARIAAAG